MCEWSEWSTRKCTKRTEGPLRGLESCTEPSSPGRRRSRDSKTSSMKSRRRCSSTDPSDRIPSRERSAARRMNKSRNYRSVCFCKENIAKFSEKNWNVLHGCATIIMAHLIFVQLIAIKLIVFYFEISNICVQKAMHDDTENLRKVVEKRTRVEKDKNQVENMLNSHLYRVRDNLQAVRQFSFDDREMNPLCRTQTTLECRRRETICPLKPLNWFSSTRGTHFSNFIKFYRIYFF